MASTGKVALKFIITVHTLDQRGRIDVFKVNVWLLAEPTGISTCATTSVPAVTGIEVGLPRRSEPHERCSLSAEA